MPLSYLSENFAIRIIVVVIWCYSWMGLFNCFSLLVAIISLSKSIRTRPQWAGFWVRFRSIYPNFESEVCGIFSNMELSPVLGNQGQQQYCFRSLLDSSKQQIEQSFPIPGTRVLLDRLSFGQKLCLPSCHSYN